jgi:hypothetical protein
MVGRFQISACTRGDGLMNVALISFTRTFYAQNTRALDLTGCMYIAYGIMNKARVV